MNDNELEVKNALWRNKLKGKKYVDETQTTIEENNNNIPIITKKDLPECHRIIGPNTGYTMDYRVERYDIFALLEPYDIYITDMHLW